MLSVVVTSEHEKCAKFFVVHGSVYKVAAFMQEHSPKHVCIPWPF